MASRARKTPAKKGKGLAPPARIDAVAKRFIPTEAPQIVNMQTERNSVGITMKESIPLILVGHTGTAKTKLLQRMHLDTGWPYRAITAHGQVEVDTLIGKWVATRATGMEYKLGLLPFCMKYGIAVGIQEVNVVLPEVLVLLHEYVDEGYITLMDLDPEHPDFIIRPHENFRLYGTMNPPELYPGTRELSPALVRRCMVRKVQPLSSIEEVEVVTQQVPSCEPEVATQMAGVAASVRQQFDAGQTLFWLSTADLVMWARLCEHVDPYEAGEIAVVGKAPTADVDFVRGRVRLAFDPDTTHDVPHGDDDGVI